MTGIEGGRANSYASCRQSSASFLLGALIITDRAAVSLSWVVSAIS